MVLTEDEIKVLTALVNSRTGTMLMSVLERRQKTHFEAWLNKLDEDAGAHLRGKAAELRDLLTLFNKLKKE